MAKFRYKIGRSMTPPVELKDSSEARELTIILSKWFHAHIKCVNCENDRVIYEQKK